MEETWASGSSGLLSNTDSHTQLDTGFDSKIAFIGVGNSVDPI